MKRRTYYMHTINGQPAAAVWSDRRRVIVFAGQSVSTSQMEPSLRALYKAQSESRAHDATAPVGLPWKYGYVRVVVEQEEPRNG